MAMKITQPLTNHGASARYEIIDGQQRTISLCRYIAGKFMCEGFYFEQLQEKDP